MYMLNDFTETLRSFFRTHVDLDIDVKLPTVKRDVNGHVRFYAAKDLLNLVGQLMQNLTSVDRCSYSPDYLTIWLKKDLWTSNVIKEVLTFARTYGSNEQHKGIVLTVNADEYDDSVTFLRIFLLKAAVQNLAKISGCTIGSNGLSLLVSKKNNPSNTNLILCGSVVCNVKVEEYKLRKHNAITQMSANRVEGYKYPCHIVSKLCYASILYELLSVRHNKVVNTECDASNKDNGIFIMYNYSRLSQVWAAYEKQVVEKYYKPLPDINTIDFGLLTSEEEWLLILNYLSTYPSVIQESVKYLQSGNVDVHRLCKFLMEMTSAVSLFYHRHHILSDPIPSLLPLMYARLYLVKSLIQVYENAFQILEIDNIPEM